MSNRRTRRRACGVAVRHERILHPGEGHPIDQSKREEVFTAVREWFAKHGVK